MLGIFIRLAAAVGVTSVARCSAGHQLHYLVIAAPPQPPDFNTLHIDSGSLMLQIIGLCLCDCEFKSKSEKRAFIQKRVYIYIYINMRMFLLKVHRAFKIETRFFMWYRN